MPEADAIELNRRLLAACERWHLAKARGLYVRLNRHRIPASVRAFSQAFRGTFPALRLLHIARLVERLKPAVVVEFGAGISTAMLAEMVKPYGGRVVSYEQAPDYHAALLKALPDHLREAVEVRLCTVRSSRFSDLTGIWYDAEIPDADLVYIDGPTKPPGWPKGKFRFNADLIRMAQAGRRIGYAFTDHRWAALPAYREQLPGHRAAVSLFWKSIIVTPR